MDSFQQDSRKDPNALVATDAGKDIEIYGRSIDFFFQTNRDKGMH